METIEVQALPLQCASCGSFMVHKIKTHSLECINCKSTKAIDTKLHISNKKELHSAQEPTINPLKKRVDCPGCGADNIFEDFEIARRCTYCKSPLVTKTTNALSIDAIIPFFIDKEEAKSIFKKWLGSLWFAPNSLSDLKHFEHNFSPLYIPYFSFDAKTFSFYKGERGDAYYVRVQRRAIINGEERIVEQMERRIRWSYVQGSVQREFRDILVDAQESIPKLIAQMNRYDLNRLVEYNPSFFSGYKSLEYNQEVSQSYKRAQKYMSHIIYEDVLWDIGGDEQRVHSISTNYSDEKFELLSLPIWLSSFQYGNKEYNIIINGVSGEIIGERPYSYVKIALLVFFILSVLALLFYLDKQFNFLEQSIY